MAVVEKIFNNWLFRVMSTWFAQYVQAKTLESVQEAEAIADHTVKQAQAIADSFSIINVGTADNVAQINDAFAADSTAASLTVTQQWPGESEPSQHIVYPQIMYIGG
jgi:regulator of protease activity HflC (stomatin/prohibitin superfamily)